MEKPIIFVLLAVWFMAGCAGRNSASSQSPAIPESKPIYVSAAGVVTNLPPPPPGGSPRPIRPSGEYETNAVINAYDQAITQAIQNRWYDVLDRMGGTKDTGKVVVMWQLYPDGRARNLRVTEGGPYKKSSLMALKAVLDAQPFRPWPPELRQVCTNEYRDITFTFDMRRP